MNPMLPYKVLFLDWKRRDCNTRFCRHVEPRCGRDFYDIWSYDPRGSARACDVRLSDARRCRPTKKLCRRRPLLSLSTHPANLPVSVHHAQRIHEEARRYGWRTLRLENEYLSGTLLPDLGGRLYSCQVTERPGDVPSHPSIQKAASGIRGAWIAAGSR